MLKLCLESNLCRYSSNDSWCAHSSALGTVLSLLRSLPGWDTGQKTRDFCDQLYTNTLNHSESK